MSNKTIKIEESDKPLSAREAMSLAELEHKIVKDFAAFYRVGQALAEIKELRLYRNDVGRTFEQYCKELWDMSQSKAYQLIDGSMVYGHLQLQCEAKSSTNCGTFGGQENINDSKLPLNEAQVRPLTRFKDHPEQIKTVWQEAIESAPKGKVTASHVSKVVKNYLGEKIEKTVHKAREKVAKNSSFEFSAAFETFSAQILSERNSGYKNISRGEIIQALDQLRADLAEDGELIEDQAFRGGSDDRSKLGKAGFSLFRTDRSSMAVKTLNDTGAWVKYSGPYATIKEMDAALSTILLDDKNLRG